MITKIRALYDEFPRTFWILTTATFIDRLGGALLFPFFALYVTSRFDVGMTEVGILFALFSMSSILGSLLGGALADKIGRRWMIIFGLVVSALSSLGMMVVNDLQLFYILAGVVGLLAETGGPAQGAMVADLLPPEKRTQGYGVLRVAVNLAVTIGPALGGLLATRSYVYLFVLDAISSLITALIVYGGLPETKPERAEGEAEQSLGESMQGYGTVVRDRLFLAFLALSSFTVLVYAQMNSTLGVYLRDIHRQPDQLYGLLLSLNAALVVLLQFWISRRLAGQPPMRMLALGTALYAVGFAMYGVVATFALFALAMVVITLGEMVLIPVAQSLAARFAPEAMRGRYMAMYGFSWAIPFAVGPLAAGLIMDNGDPRWVWYAAGLVGSGAALGYLALNPLVQARFVTADSEAGAGVSPAQVAPDAGR